MLEEAGRLEASRTITILLVMTVDLLGKSDREVVRNRMGGESKRNQHPLVSSGCNSRPAMVAKRAKPDRDCNWRPGEKPTWCARWMKRVERESPTDNLKVAPALLQLHDFFFSPCPRYISREGDWRMAVLPVARGPCPADVPSEYTIFTTREPSHCVVAGRATRVHGGAVDSFLGGADSAAGTISKSCT